MKRKDLLKMFFKNGWQIVREGNSHTIVSDGNHVEPIPRHKEINETLARMLIKKHSLK